MSEYHYIGVTTADLGYIHKQVAASGTMTDKSLEVCTQGTDLVIQFTNSLSAEDKTILDGIVADAQNYPLAEIQAQKIGALKLEITGFLISRYPVPTQSSLNFLMNEASSKGWTNRVIKIQKGIDFLVQGLDEYYTRRDEVVAATTASGVQVVALDLVTLAAADPKLDLEAVKNIID